MSNFIDFSGFYSMFFFGGTFLLTYKRKVNLSLIKSLSLFWFLYLAIYKFSESDFGPIARGFDVRIIGFFLSFFVFYTFFVSLKYKGGFEFKKIIPPELFLSIVVLAVLYTLYNFVVVISQTGSFFNYRDYLLESGGSIRVGTSFPLLAALLIYSRHRCRFNPKLIAFSLFVLAVISSSKIFIVLAMLFIVPWYERSFNASIFRLLLILLFCISGFMLLHLILGKYVGSSNVFLALLFTLKGYVLGGVAVFQEVLRGDIVFPDGFYIDSFLRLVPFVGFEYYHVLDNDGWYRTGIWLGNVYSAFSFWEELAGFYSFPIAGVIIGSIYGLVHGVNRYEFRLLKNFSYYPIIFIIFSEQFLLGLGMWLSFSLATIFLLFVKD